MAFPPAIEKPGRRSDKNQGLAPALRLLVFAAIVLLPLVSVLPWPAVPGALQGLGQGLAWAGEPPAEPMLRIETGMHTARIVRIAIDRQNRFLVTASDDKTLRVWDLATGEALSVIRPPIGPGYEGMLFAAAMSPDGSAIACGGWTQFNGGGTDISPDGYTIYLFERASGRMIHLIGGMPNIINHLAFSPDGRFLAAAFGDGSVRVWSARDYSQAGKDGNYGADCYCVAFDGRNRLVTTSYDGFLRLYASVDEAKDGELELVAKQKAPGGSQPFSAVFSPDNEKIAVCFNDGARVNVLSAKDLSPLYEPDTTGLDGGNLACIAFSVDGRSLYAGGRCSSGSSYPIRRWSEAGRGPYTDLPASNNTIMHILPLNGGGVVFGASDPAFGVINAAGEKTLYKSPGIADFRDNGQGFRISGDASRVRYAYEEDGGAPAIFSLETRRIDVGGEDGSLYLPLTEASGIEVGDWFNSLNPTLNGRGLRLKQYETSRRLAVAPDAQSLLLGTDWYLRRFDRRGEQAWEVPTPAPAWAVNISRDGGLAVAAFSGGTIRWYDYASGKEILAFFPAADKKRWVLWSPSGYYDCSPGGEDLIGWHVNNGGDRAADFFAASRFRNTFYRPDVIAKVLQTRDEAEALRLADAESGRKVQQADVSRMLPPVVAIIYPAEGDPVSQKDLTLRFLVRSPSGEPVTAVRAFVDGRPAAQARGVAVAPAPAGGDGELRELAVSIPERDCEISVLAENRFSAGDPAVTRVRWAGKAPEPQFAAKPALYVLAVGVSEYADSSLRLKYPAKDARDFAAAFTAQKGLLYRDVVVKVLTDQEATKDDVLDGLEWLQQQTTSRDVAVLFIAGHGVDDPSGIYYFLPQNADLARLKRTGLPFSDIKNTVAAIAGKVLCFVDTCHSGDVMGARRGVADINAVVNELSSAENGVVVFASSTGRQYSMESDNWGNGAFTKAVVEGLNGGAAYQGERITINMMDLFISERVKALTGGKQTPTTTKPATVPDFPVAMKR